MASQRGVDIFMRVVLSGERAPSRTILVQMQNGCFRMLGAKLWKQHSSEEKQSF